MGSPMKTKILAAIFCLALPLPAFAGWVGPKVVVSGTWGNGPGQFGIEREEGMSVIPNRIYLLKSEYLIIGDFLNGRRKIYDQTKKLKKIVVCKEQGVDSDIYNEECNIQGRYLLTNFDGTLWTALPDWPEPGKPEEYRKYSPTGQLLQTYTTRPLELGIWDEKPILINGEKKYQVTIKFPDLNYPGKVTSWMIIGDEIFPNYQRDMQGNLYGLGPGSGYGGEVIRYDKKGSALAKLRLPDEQVSRTPILDRNGNVYCYMESETHYKILKWTWKD